MAVYGTNILPSFGSAWTVDEGDTATMSGGVLMASVWDIVRYRRDFSDYNLSGTMYISCNSCTGRFTLNIYYWDLDTDELYSSSVNITTAGISVPIAIQSARVSQIRFGVYCLEAGTLGPVTVQLEVATDSSGSNYSGDTTVDSQTHEFYAYPPFNGELEIEKLTTNTYHEVAFMNLRLDPVMVNKFPTTAYVDIEAHVNIKNMPHYSTGSIISKCYIALFQGTKLIAGEMVNCIDDKNIVACLNVKLEAKDCTMLDTIQDVPLKLCIAPLGTFCVVLSNETYIKASGTVLKGSQYAIQQAAVSVYKAASGSYTIRKTFPQGIADEYVDLIMLYNYEKPQTAYIVSSEEKHEYISGSWVNNTYWYIHSIDILGPFASDSSANQGGLTLRKTIQDNTISKMKLTAITHIADPGSMRAGTYWDPELGYKVSTNNNDILRVQLSTSGVLSICKLDGTSNKVIASNVVDFDVVQQGCNNFWYQHTDADRDSPVYYQDTIGFTIVYITNSAVKVACYPIPNSKAASSTSVAYNPNLIGVYDVYPPNNSAQGDSGTYVYKKVNLEALHLFGDGAGDGQTAFTLYFGLTLFYTYTNNSGSVFNEWHYGLLEYGMSPVTSGVIGEGAIYTDIQWYFACVNTYNLYYNIYYPYSPSILPSTNSNTFLSSESNISEDEDLRLFGVDLCGGAEAYTEWESQCNFFLMCTGYSLRYKYSKLKWSSGYTRVIPHLGCRSFTQCIRHLPSGELARLDIYTKENSRYTALHYNLMPRMHWFYNVRHTQNDTQATLRYRYYTDTNIAYTFSRDTAYNQLPGTSTYGSCYHTVLPDYQYGTYFNYTTVPSSIQGLVTLNSCLPVRISDTKNQYTDRNDFAFTGWLPTNTDVTLPNRGD